MDTCNITDANATNGKFRYISSSEQGNSFNIRKNVASGQPSATLQYIGWF